MAIFDEFYDAWNFLVQHPMFEYETASMFHQCLDIGVCKVNPEREAVDPDETKNTATRLWLECGPYYRPEDLSEAEREHFPYGVPSLDEDLTCAAPTFEEAIIKLANRVVRKYGKRGKKGRNVTLPAPMSLIDEVVRRHVERERQQIAEGDADDQTGRTVDAQEFLKELREETRQRNTRKNES